MTDQRYYMSRSSIKPTKSHEFPAKTRVSLYALFAQSDQFRCTREDCIPFGFLATKQCQAKTLISLSDCTGRSARLHRLIGVFAGCTCGFVGFVMLGLNLYVSATCSKFSGLFTVYHDHALSDSNNKLIRPSSLKQCEKACITETDFMCRSIDYLLFDKTCYLSSDNKCTAPEKFTSLSDWVYCQRNCLDWCTFYPHLSQRLIGELIHVV